MSRVIGVQFDIAWEDKAANHQQSLRKPWPKATRAAGDEAL